MANLGKFIDRSPVICAAGLPSGQHDTVGSCMKQYSLQDGVDACKHDAKIWKDECPVPFKVQPLKRNCRHRGVHTEIKSILNPQVKTRYQTLINDLKETAYHSYWKKPLGKARDEVPGLPRGMNKMETTFGTPSKRESSIKELINPSKTPYEVLWESQIGHEMYKKTHNDYNTGEHKSQNYLSPPFDPNIRFGERSKYDPRGIGVNCAMKWINLEPTTVVNEIQADFCQKTRSKIAKYLAPNKVLDQVVPPGHTFGDPSVRPMYNVEDLLKDQECTPNLYKRDFMQWLISMRALRSALDWMSKNTDFSFTKLESKFKYYDKENCKCLPLDVFYDICDCYNIIFDKNNMENLLRQMNVIQNNKINYQKFIQVVNTDASTIEMPKIEDIPEDHKFFTTSAQAAACDYLFIDNSKMPTAGIPSARNDLARQPSPDEGSRADIPNLGMQTRAETLINPSIYVNYGLSFRDFFMPREPDVIRKLFEKIGYNLTDEDFEKLWKRGIENDKTGKVCVATFYDILKIHVKSQEIKVDEADMC